VQLHGGDLEEVRVELDPARVAALGVSADEVAQAIRRDNVNRPGGALTDQRSRYLVRTVHEARSPAELREVIVRSRGGAELRLSEVAEVRRVPLERTELALVDGQRGGRARGLSRGRRQHRRGRARRARGAAGPAPAAGRARGRAQ
jgi:multidrug efflux pump subunit AcrB